MSPARRSAMQVDVLVDSSGWPSTPTLRHLARRAVDAAIAETGIALRPGTEVSLVFSSDEHLQRLNSAYRNKDAPTNVLSFPSPLVRNGATAHVLGDIVLARETIEREALSEGLTTADHLAHLIVHGLLHLCGYDHQTDDQAAVMEDLESRIMGRLGIADPYAVPDPGQLPERGDRDDERRRPIK